MIGTAAGDDAGKPHGCASAAEWNFPPREKIELGTPGTYSQVRNSRIVPVGTILNHEIASTISTTTRMATSVSNSTGIRPSATSVGALDFGVITGVDAHLRAENLPNHGINGA